MDNLLSITEQALQSMLKEVAAQRDWLSLVSEDASKDAFGDRMKAYEAVETERKLCAPLPIYVRLDGRAFSTFTRGLQRPYDPMIMQAMISTMSYLVEKTSARIGYTQSDEISLVIFNDNPESEVLFGGKVFKITSVLAGMATAKFMSVLPETLRAKLPHFDCRVMLLPSRTEAANMVLWRAMDAKKNAIQATAQTYFSAKQLKGKKQAEMENMLKEGMGINVNMLLPAFLHGTFGQRVTYETYLTEEELKTIPEFKRPVGPVIRHRIKTFALSMAFNQVTNREEMIFDKAEPEYKMGE